MTKEKKSERSEPGTGKAWVIVFFGLLLSLLFLVGVLLWLWVPGEMTKSCEEWFRHNQQGMSIRDATEYLPEVMHFGWWMVFGLFFGVIFFGLLYLAERTTWRRTSRSWRMLWLSLSLATLALLGPSIMNLAIWGIQADSKQHVAFGAAIGKSCLRSDKGKACYVQEDSRGNKKCTDGFHPLGTILDFPGKDDLAKGEYRYKYGASMRWSLLVSLLMSVAVFLVGEQILMGVKRNREGKQ